jgi:hypothetical protein
MAKKTEYQADSNGSVGIDKASLQEQFDALVRDLGMERDTSSKEPRYYKVSKTLLKPAE